MPTNPSSDVPAEPEQPQLSDVDAAADADEETPLNRAERRARGKGKAAPQPTARGKVVGSHGPAHAQRNWANRRSG